MDVYIGGCFASYLWWYFQHKNIYEFVLLYDSWMQNPKSETSKLFESLGLSESFVSEALKALNKDSQNKFFGQSDGKLNIISEVQWVRINGIFENFELPLKHNMSIEEYKSLFHCEIQE